MDEKRYEGRGVMGGGTKGEGGWEEVRRWRGMEGGTKVEGGWEEVRREKGDGRR